MEKGTEILVGVLASVAFTISAFEMKELYVIHSDIELLKQENKQEERNQRVMKTHWRLHRWAHDQINDLRDKQDLPLARWPDLGERPD